MRFGCPRRHVGAVSGDPHGDGTRRPPARGRCERGVGARTSLLPGRSGLPAPEALGGEPATAGRDLGPGDRVVRHRVPLRDRRCLPAVASPRFLAPRVRPVNVLSGHSDDMADDMVRVAAHPRAGGSPGPRSQRAAPGIRRIPLRHSCPQRRPSCHTCHGRAGLPSHPGRPLTVHRSTSFTPHRLGDRQRSARLPPAAVPGRRRRARREVQLVTDRRLWSYKDIAAHIRVQPDTVRSYRKHGLLPPPDHVEGGSRTGTRTRSGPGWRPALATGSGRPENRSVPR